MSVHEVDPEELLRRTAALARLSIAADARADLAHQFTRILEAFHGLAELDVDNVEPLLTPAELADVTRADLARPSLAPDQALGNAPARTDDFFSVPKTVGGET
jgi:aspartyl-tRNA(Asn)/glutamyl-tRNA(Gln) amidotransferase subunit C